MVVISTIETTLGFENVLFLMYSNSEHSGEFLQA